MTTKSYFSRPNRLHSMADVNRVLAERTGRSGEVIHPSGAPVPPASTAAADALTWMPKVKGMEAILSACGRYSISRAAIDGRFCYTAWSRLPTPRPIGEGVYVAEMAKELCEDHLRSQSCAT